MALDMADPSSSQLRRQRIPRDANESDMDKMVRSSSGKRVQRESGKPPRTASKDVRRHQLIEATIDSLAKRGYAETTMADVADGAGLSRGIVNFHFESKEKLLVATLQYMSDEYAAHWRASFDEAGDVPADRLRALVTADFDRSICTRRKLAAWCAFWGEAKSRPTYQALCGSRDEIYQQLVADLCRELKQEAGYAYDSEAIALALSSVLEGLWLRLMLGTEGVSRQTALHSALEFLAVTFPRHFERPQRASDS